MGLFDLFSKEGRQKGALAKSIAKTKDKNAKSEDRFPAMIRLKEMGDEEALYGLAQRFTFNYDKMIEDEQEKQWVYESFLELGDKSIAPLRRYILNASNISYALRLLAQLCEPRQLLDIVDEALEREEPGYTRDPSKKIQLLSWLGDLDKCSAEDIAKRLVPYLEDFDENVRFTAIEALDLHHHEGSTKDALITAMVKPEEESRRLKVRMAELLSKAGWRVTDRKNDLAPLLEGELNDFKLQKDTIVRR